VRMDTYMDSYQNLLRIRLAYKNETFAEQAINLRGY